MKCKRKDQRNQCFNLKGDFLKMEQILLFILKIKLIAISFSDMYPTISFKTFFVNFYLVEEKRVCITFLSDDFYLQDPRRPLDPVR